MKVIRSRFRPKGRQTVELGVSDTPLQALQFAVVSPLSVHSVRGFSGFAAAACADDFPQGEPSKHTTGDSSSRIPTHVRHVEQTLHAGRLLGGQSCFLFNDHLCPRGKSRHMVFQTLLYEASGTQIIELERGQYMSSHDLPRSRRKRPLWMHLAIVLSLFGLAASSLLAQGPDTREASAVRSRILLARLCRMPKSPSPALRLLVRSRFCPTLLAYIAFLQFRPVFTPLTVEAVGFAQRKLRT